MFKYTQPAPGFNIAAALKGILMRKKTIGILAGMGPRSTAPFLEMVIDECQRQYNANDDIDFPPIIIYSLPTPFFVNSPIDHLLMKKTIRSGLKKLEKTGAAFIAMPCNTAHLYYEELSGNIDIPLLNIIGETIKKTPSKIRRIALLATKPTFDSGIYQNALRRKSPDICIPNNWQQPINRLISAIKTSNNTALVEQMWKDLLLLMESQKIDTAIIACTELSKLCRQESTNIFLLDTARTLASAVVRKWLALSRD